MKEYIYTIPLNEAMEQDTECPLCILEKKLESDGITYALGPAMMEPNHRILSNEKGYCRRHYEKMLSGGNKLSYALILQTHIFELSDNWKSMTGQKNKVLGKLKRSGKSDALLKIADRLDALGKDCCICEKLEGQMLSAADNFIYLWKTEREFRQKVKNSKGLCLSHISLLLRQAVKNLSPKDLEDFSADLYALTSASLDRLYDELDWFVKKHDYRFKDEPWKNSEDVIPRTASKLGKFVP